MENSNDVQNPTNVGNEVLADVSCRTFIDFLRKNGYEIKKANPRHRPGEGYSPAPYYGDVNIDSAIEHFVKQYGN